jgi:hypothetical protein
MEGLTTWQRKASKIWFKRNLYNSHLKHRQIQTSHLKWWWSWSAEFWQKLFNSKFGLHLFSFDYFWSLTIWKKYAKLNFIVRVSPYLTPTYYVFYLLASSRLPYKTYCVYLSIISSFYFNGDSIQHFITLMDTTYSNVKKLHSINGYPVS